MCVAAPAGDAQCTRTCDGDDDSDCPEGSFCDTGGSEARCTRLPTGMGEACESDEACAGYDASFCAVGNPAGPTCTVAPCAEGGCPPGTVCVDLSFLDPAIPPLCGEPF